MSFFTSLSGLQAAQTNMSTISQNLANVSTNGFKRSVTQFADVIASTANSNPNQMVGSGTVVKSVKQDFSQGGYTQSSSALDMAVSGDGFFVVKSSQSGNTVSYTRDGSFEVDSNNYVVDSQGNRLQVYPVDGSGAVVATSLGATTNLRLPQTSGTPKATGSVDLSVNLSASASNPSGTFDRFDPSTYNQSSQTTIYDASGSPMTMTNYYVRTSQPTASNPTSEWTVYSFVGDQQLTSGSGANSSTTLTFDANGNLTSPTGPIKFDGFLSPGATSGQAVSLTFSNTTQTGSTFTAKASSQDGSAVGQFEGVTVGDDGMVKATYSNGDNLALGKIVLANFSNPSGLRQLGNSTWSATGLSGEPKLGEPGANGYGSLMSGALESSNVDITQELVDLIAAQRNFQANAKALDTASQISQTIFNIQS